MGLNSSVHHLTSHYLNVVHLTSKPPNSMDDSLANSYPLSNISHENPKASTAPSSLLTRDGVKQPIMGTPTMVDMHVHHVENPMLDVHRTAAPFPSTLENPNFSHHQSKSGLDGFISRIDLFKDLSKSRIFSYELQENHDPKCM